MKNSILLSLATFIIHTAYTQKPILIFDLEKGTLDSIMTIEYDSTLLHDHTNYFIGNVDSNIATLEQTPPLAHVFSNSQFTIKKRADIDFDLTTYPVRTSVKLFSMENDTLTGVCSGSLISRRHVLTAAHCFLNPAANTVTTDSIYTCPIYNNGTPNSSFNCNYATKLYFLKDWNISIGEDIMLVELDKPIGDETGWISIGYHQIDSLLLDGTFYKFSYPNGNEFQTGSEIYNGDTLYYNYGKADLADNHFIGINHTGGITGESGSSLINVENEQRYTSYGVLSWSGNLRHSRLTNWKFHALKHIIHNDLDTSIPEETKESSFVLYPNPATDQIHLKDIPTKTPITYALYDSWGKRITAPMAYNDDQGINISHLSDGVYYLNLSSDTFTVTTKVIKLKTNN